MANCYGKVEQKSQSKKCKHTDGRIRRCWTCDEQFWTKQSLFCKIRLRRFGAILWPDPQAYIPGFARVEDEKCPLGRWKIETNG